MSGGGRRGWARVGQTSLWFGLKQSPPLFLSRPSTDLGHGFMCVFPGTRFCCPRMTSCTAALGPCGYSKARFNLPSSPGQDFETKGCWELLTSVDRKKVLKWQQGCLGTYCRCCQIYNNVAVSGLAEKLLNQGRFYRAGIWAVFLKMGPCSSAAEAFLAQHILLKSKLQQILNLFLQGQSFQV